MTHDSMGTLHATPSVQRVTDELEKPEQDNRSYRVVQLRNGMPALLAHDPEADKASASLSVHVGCFSDEEDMPGLAHAVEHTLFMGSRKFPAENDYSQYLANHAGRCNAETAQTTTTFWFDVSAKVSAKPIDDQQASPLKGGLERFAAFFEDPLFSEGTLHRELHAVDSEHQKNIGNDILRSHQLDKSLSNPGHPFCHFSTGNLETLKNIPEAKGIDVRAKFVEFHRKHYSANIMTLAVLGKEPLDTLERWVAEYFSPIPNRDLVPNSWEGVPYRQSELCEQVFAKPVKDIRRLKLVFPFPNQEQMAASQAGQYVSHLLGHESPGSILASLREKGWAENLSVRFYPTCSGYVSLLYLWVDLEEEGLKNYKEVVKVIFQYVTLLREELPKEWIFRELQSMANVNFRWEERMSAISFTKETSLKMHGPLPYKWLLSRLNRPREFDVPSIEKALECLRPNNFRMTITSRTYPGNWDKKERWYGTEFLQEEIPKEVMTEIQKAASTTAYERISCLHLPEMNPYIPANFEILNTKIGESTLAPRPFRQDAILVWPKQDTTFKVPKAHVFINFCNPLVYSTATNAVKSRLLVNLIKDTLKSHTYYAELAGLRYSLERDASGMCLKLYGYNDKLAAFLKLVLEKIRDLEIEDDRFNIICDSLARDYNNWGFSAPYLQVSDYTANLNSKCDFTREDLLAELPKITAEDVRDFKKDLLSQSHIAIYGHGNLDEESVREVAKMVDAILTPCPPPSSRGPVDRSLTIPSGLNHVYKKTLKDPQNANNCIEFWLYTGQQRHRLTRVKTMLFRQMCHESAFDQLRTKKQLGYVVFCEAKSASGNYGLSLIIQSAQSPEDLDGRIEDFLDSFSIKLENMPEKMFDDHKRSLRDQLLEKSNNLGEESNKHWEQIITGYEDFDQGMKDAEELENLTMHDMKEFSRKHIERRSETRAKLAVYLRAQAPSLNLEPITKGSADGEKSNGGASKPVCIEEISEFRKALLAQEGQKVQPLQG
ncbi:peptidase M16 inactive domain-containing protein [Colletotrichum somersetense]|nr:peptidase M16 inactive domain-containing protein [Colletotrichum somersetense]